MNKKQPLALILAANIFITGASGIKATERVELPRTIENEVVTKKINIISGIKIAINSNPYIPKDANGKEVMVFASEGTTQVPVRAICNAIPGVAIEYVASEKGVYITTNGNSTLIKNDNSKETSALKEENKTIEVVPGLKVYIDGKLQVFKDANGKIVEPYAYNGTTYLPLRGIMEALNIPVDWDSKTKTVMLGIQKEIAPKDEYTKLMDMCDLWEKNIPQYEAIYLDIQDGVERAGLMFDTFSSYPNIENDPLYIEFDNLFTELALKIMGKERIISLREVASFRKLINAVKNGNPTHDYLNNYDALNAEISGVFAAAELMSENYSPQNIDNLVNQCEAIKNKIVKKYNIKALVLTN